MALKDQSSDTPSPSLVPSSEITIDNSTIYPWKFITEEFIENPQNITKSLLSKISKNEIDVNDIFYEIFLIITESPNRISRQILLQLISDIILNYNEVEKRAKISENFIILAQSFKMDKNLSSFINDCSIDIRFKILHLGKSALISEKIFPEYGKYQYNDLRNRIFTVDSFSSLHEASEGYSKFITQIFSYFDLQSNDFDNIPTLIDLLNRLIGEFNLDNNRCFLLLLNILSFYIDTKETLVLKILEQSPWWNLSQFNYTIQTTIVDYLLNYVGIECKELKLITLLIKNKVLEFDSIYNSLGPLEFSITDSVSIKPIENNEILELYKATKIKILEDSKLSTASALALAAPLLPDSDDDDDDDNDKNINSNSKNDSKVKSDDNDKLDTKTGKEIPILEKAKLFRKLQFLEYLIDYEMIDELLLVLVQYPQIPLISDKIADKLNILVDKFISPFYFEFVDNLNITNQIPNLNSSHLIKSIDDYLKFSTKFLSFNKYKLSRNSSLLTKMIRIMKQSIHSNLKSKEFWLQFYRLNIFPCLSFTNNIPLVNEAFEVFFNNYPLETRYNLYGEYQLLVKKDEITKLNYDITEKKTRDLLKRLSVENVNISCRSLNKLCSINPLATTNAFISHIESYNSLIDLVCESSKFFNDFSWDVITFQLLNKLNSNRQIIQTDGLNYSLWFVNLSQFIGKLGKLYPKSFQLYPILIDIIKCLRIRNYDILSVVKELLDSMTGIKSITNLTVKQIMRMNAETSLRKFAYMSIQDNRESCTRSCTKLIEVMVDNKLLVQLYILLCSVPINLIEKANDKPLKFVNQKSDEVTSLIHNFTAALDSNLNIEIFKKNMISVIDLINDYKIPVQWAFEIWRRTWSRDIKNNNNESKIIFDSIKEDLKISLNTINWNLLNVEFYLTFWQLSLYDINYDDLSYMMEYSDLKTQITGISMKLRQQKQELSLNEKNELEKKRDVLMTILTNIRDDMTVHENNYKLVLDRLNREKNWFDESDNGFESEQLNDRINKRSLALLESCFLPRIQHSSFDAVFVSKFIFFIHKLKINGYSLKSILSNIFMFDILPVTLFINTTLETENLGFFYQIILEKLHEWWENAEIYERESFKFNEELNHADYCKLLFTWHESLLKQTLKSLNSDSYTTRNNAILFLKVILSNFPVVEELANPLTTKLEETIENDERDDIKLASRALIGLIKFKKNKFISIWKFYEMEEEEKNKAMAIKAENEKKEKEKEESVERKRLEEEKKNKEKIKLEQLRKTPSKPYGLVGLSAKKEEKDQKAKEEVKKDVKNDVKNKSTVADNRTEKVEIKREVNVTSKNVEKNDDKVKSLPIVAETVVKPKMPSSLTNILSKGKEEEKETVKEMKSKVDSIKKEAASNASKLPLSGLTSQLPEQPVTNVVKQTISKEKSEPVNNVIKCNNNNNNNSLHKLPAKAASSQLSHSTIYSSTTNNTSNNNNNRWNKYRNDMSQGRYDDNYYNQQQNRGQYLFRNDNNNSKNTQSTNYNRNSSYDHRDNRNNNNKNSNIYNRSNSKQMPVPLPPPPTPPPGSSNSSANNNIHNNNNNNSNNNHNNNRKRRVNGGSNDYNMNDNKNNNDNRRNVSNNYVYNKRPRR